MGMRQMKHILACLLLVSELFTASGYSRTSQTIEGSGVAVELSSHGGAKHASIMRHEGQQGTQAQKRGSAIQGRNSTFHNIEFGGRNMIAWTNSTTDTDWSFMPQLVKTERCTGSTCEPCQATPACSWCSLGNPPTPCVCGCFKGSDVYAPLFGTSHHGTMVVRAEQGAVYDSYAFQAWVDCQDAANTRWTLTIISDDTDEISNGRGTLFQNGRIKIFVDLVEMKTIELAEFDQYATQQNMHHYTFNIEIGPHGDARPQAHIRVVFEPVDKNLRSGVQLGLHASNVGSAGATCMDSTACLSRFGPYTSDMITFRNNNEMQKVCLKNGPDGMDQKGWNNLRATCDDWRGCLDDTTERDLTDLLEAGFFQSGSVTATSTTSDDPNTCIDPERADIEAFNCDCVSAVKEQCYLVKKDLPLSQCYFLEMCGHDKVCCNWKLTHNCPALLTTGVCSATVATTATTVTNTDTTSDNTTLAQTTGFLKLKENGQLRTATAQEVDSILTHMVKRRSPSKLAAMAADQDSTLDGTIVNKCISG